MSSSKVAAVTGGNKGIGLAIVRALCKQFDGTVYLTARDEDRGRNAVKMLQAEGLHPQFHLLDINNEKNVDVFKDYLVAKYGGIDVFVHNAAIAFKQKDPAPFSRQATETIFANYTSAVYLCNTILPCIKAHGRRSILASQSGTSALKRCNTQNRNFFKSPDLTEELLSKKLCDFVQSAQTDSHQNEGFANSAYGMSKLGVIAYTRILGKRAKKLTQPNVLVNSCCPGYVDTDMTSHKGPLTPDQGALTPVFLAMLPKGDETPNGEFLYQKKVVQWYK